MDTKVTVIVPTFNERENVAELVARTAAALTGYDAEILFVDDSSDDTADEVHLHGYDRSAFVTAGATATLRFDADVPGVFELELEQSGTPLARLEIS